LTVDGVLQRPGNVIQRHGVVETDVFPEKDILDLELPTVGVRLGGEPARQIAVGFRVPHTPAVDKKDDHETGKCMEASMPGAQFSGKRLNRRIAESPKETKEHERTRKTCRGAAPSFRPFSFFSAIE
jgi:hypothetical protein